MVGYAGEIIAENSGAMLWPIESPTNNIEPTTPASSGEPKTGVAPNHGAGKPNEVLKDQPETLTEPAVPVIVTSSV